MALDLDLVDRIRELVATEPGLTERRMFGGLAFLINGNMSVTASRTGGLLARVPPDEVAALVDEHAQPAVMGGREMRGWLTVSAEVVADDEELAGWVARSVRFARALPAK